MLRHSGVAKIAGAVSLVVFGALVAPTPTFAGSTTASVVSARGPLSRPDLMVRHRSGEPWFGDGEFLPTTQAYELTIAPGATKSFQIRLQNKGRVAHRFTLRLRKWYPHSSVRFYDGGRDVTRAVRLGRWHHRLVGFTRHRQHPQSHRLRMVVHVGRRATADGSTQRRGILTLRDGRSADAIDFQLVVIRAG